jgi:hypothetical protein
VSRLQSLASKHEALRSELNFRKKQPCPSWELGYTAFFREVPEANKV